MRGPCFVLSRSWRCELGLCGSFFHERGLQLKSPIFAAAPAAAAARLFWLPSGGVFCILSLMCGL